MFCPNCKSVLIVEEGKCKSCDAVAGKIEFSEKNIAKQKTKSESTQVETMPKVKKKCEKCGNDEAFWWSQQIAYADEPETEFYKCTKCGHTWRSMYTL